MAEAISLNVKKVSRWGKGLVVFITKEAKKFGWNDRTQVAVSAMRNEKGEFILIRKAPKEF